MQAAEGPGGAVYMALPVAEPQALTSLTATWQHCRVHNNSASAGGAAYVTASAEGAAKLNLDSCNFTDNVARAQVSNSYCYYNS